MELDVDGDGELSKEDILDGMKHRLTPEEIDQLFRKLDAEHTGKIAFHQFIAASIERKKLLTHANLQQAFKTFDADNKGVITKADLKKTMGS
jgi:calcium-dependent protein kinase